MKKYLPTFYFTRNKQLKYFLSQNQALYYAGYFWYIVNRNDKAKDYIDRAIKLNDSCIEALCVKGWMELEHDPKSAMPYFEKVLR